MYKDNKHHLQPVLICSVNELPEELREYLNTSWASQLIGSAAVSNVRRIERYLQAKAKEEMTQPAAPGAEKCTREQARGSFLAFLRASLVAWCGFARPKM